MACRSDMGTLLWDDDAEGLEALKSRLAISKRCATAADEAGGRFRFD